MIMHAVWPSRRNSFNLIIYEENPETRSRLRLERSDTDLVYMLCTADSLMIWPTLVYQFKPRSSNIWLMTIVCTESSTFLTRVVSVAVVLKSYLLRRSFSSWPRNLLRRNSLKWKNILWFTKAQNNIYNCRLVRLL